MNPRKPLVLVLDDSEDLLSFATATLESGGYQVLPAQDLTQMEAHLSQHQPDLLLVDIMMPEVLGYDLVGYLREMLGVKAPLLLFSSMNDAKLAEYVKRSGATGFVRKDPGLATLLANVQSFLPNDLRPS